MNSELLELHHIMPFSVRAIHSTDNLAILCTDHHALVERYYWNERSKLLPEEANEIRDLARRFKARAIEPDKLDWAKARTGLLWERMNKDSHCADFGWWKKMFGEAKHWAHEQTVLRSVDPKNAIIEETWFESRGKTLVS